MRHAPRQRPVERQPEPPADDRVMGGGKAVGQRHRRRLVENVAQAQAVEERAVPFVGVHRGPVLLPSGSGGVLAGPIGPEGDAAVAAG